MLPSSTKRSKCNSFYTHYPSERTVVLRALRDMKERGMLNKPSQAYAKNLASLPENDVSVAYQVVFRYLSDYINYRYIAGVLVLITHS